MAGGNEQARFVARPRIGLAAYAVDTELVPIAECVGTRLLEIEVGGETGGGQKKP